MQSRYCTALYFCFTALISVGFGNVAPNTDAEKLYAIVMMLLGCESSQFTPALSCLGWPPELRKLFGVHPWCGQQPPPTTYGTTNWLSLSLFVVVNRLHTPQQWCCNIFQLIKHLGAIQKRHKKFKKTNVDFLQCRCSKSRLHEYIFSGNSRKALGHWRLWKHIYFVVKKKNYNFQNFIKFKMLSNVTPTHSPSPAPNTEGRKHQINQNVSKIICVWKLRKTNLFWTTLSWMSFPWRDFPWIPTKRQIFVSLNLTAPNMNPTPPIFFSQITSMFVHLRLNHFLSCSCILRSTEFHKDYWGNVQPTRVG